MKPADVLIATLVALIWGLTFVASRFALNELSPAMTVALRFAVAAVPCLLLPRPKVSWPVLIAIAATLYIGQFLSQFYGIAHGVPVGLAGVIVQSQALFTVAFAALVFREMPTRAQGFGVAMAALGLLMISGTAGNEFSVGAFVIIMVSPISFAIGNLLLRYARDADMFALFAWLSLVPPLPLAVLAMLTDGATPTLQSVTRLSLTGLLAVLWLGVLGTTIAYWLWGRLLRDYPAALVAPFALLVPFVGAVASAIVFGERFGPLRLAGMLTVIAGLATSVLGSRRTVVVEAV